MIDAIVLLEEQDEDFPAYMEKIHRLLSERDPHFKIYIVANGTGNYLRKTISQSKILNNRIRAFEFYTKTTQAVCLKAILKETEGNIFLICGSYQQLTEGSMLQLIDRMGEGVDLVNPWREERIDPRLNQMQSRLFNWFVRIFVGTNLHDLSCTVRVCRRSVLEEIELYGNMFRFMPVLAESKGFKVKEVKVEHFKEKGKTGFYSISNYISRMIDIFTLFFNTRFTRKPLRFFSAVGMGILSLGIINFFLVFIQWFFYNVPIGNRHLLYISLILVSLGIIVSSSGLLGELITFSSVRHKKEYTVEKII